MHAGLYRPERLNYVDPMMTPFDGTMSLSLKGTPEKPITIKAAGDGEVIFDGAVYHAMDLNFRLKPTGKAVDAGVVLPTVNDGFHGTAPDIGALEVGKPEPKYGPRWLKRGPFYR